ncbi:hypothetical protein [Veillonella sp.]|uniref:hypothetical protein n=1 Tax=Veillonella sp. TaxID=1926307 RepID=UPI002053BEA9|nr:hypothetical protein [Veillonella sp.]MDU1127873.1 hypothetical protein [Veillonella sp.]DAH72292.1 MAG TPA: vesicle-associated membrane protein 2 [Caudoviricetes sp.]
MPNNLPDDMIEFKSDPEFFLKLAENNMPEIQYNIKLPEMPEFIIRNPNEEVENLLNQQNKKLDEQTKELHSIRYENIKLNAQIDTLDKMIDSQNNELLKLRDVNSELKIANKTLKDNNKNYWRNTFIIAFVVAAIFFV